jgi:hypothetical protein
MVHLTHFQLISSFFSPLANNIANCADGKRGVESYGYVWTWDDGDRPDDTTHNKEESPINQRRQGPKVNTTTTFLQKSRSVLFGVNNNTHPCAPSFLFPRCYGSGDADDDYDHNDNDDDLTSLSP